MSARKNEETIVGVAWYRPSQWQRLEEIAPDIKKAFESYEQWHAQATRAMSRLRREGGKPVKVEIDLEELLSWCLQQDRPVDTAARAEYTARKLQEEQSG